MHGPRLAALCALLVLPAGVWAADRGSDPQAGHRHDPRTSVSCPADVMAALTQLCPCDGFATHGQYMRCVVHLAGALRHARCPGHVSRAAIRCAAWSTCGKPAAVVCCPNLPTVCTAEPGETGTRCRTAHARLSHDAAACTADGGTPMGAGSVCTACTASTTTSTTTTSTTSSSTTVTTATTSTSTTALAAGTNYGNDVEFPDVTPATAGYLLGAPITVPVASTLTNLCVINKAAGPNMSLALYTDLGGLPDVLVASTGSTPMTLGRMEIPVVVTPLAAGTYWLMGVYDSDTSMGVDSSDPSALVAYIAQAFSSPLPDPFPPAAWYTGQRFNYYLKVE